MSEVEIQIPEKMARLFTGTYRTRVARGGRGSAKTRSMALMSAIKGYEWGSQGRSGNILCTRALMNSLEDSSLEEIQGCIEEYPFLSDYYKCTKTGIQSRDGRIGYMFAGLTHNLGSLKSKSRILLNWTDEAEDVSETAWTKLIPTVREDDSEVWVSYNPESENSATNKRFYLDHDPTRKIVDINYMDNPWFPDVLEIERQKDFINRPDDYGHIWLGEYRKAVKGAYYAKLLEDAQRQGRVRPLYADPLLPIYAYADIGGTSKKSDSFVFWIAQHAASELRVLDYYEVRGQTFADHVHWLRSNNYERAIISLPHDGVKHDTVYRVTPESFFKDAGFSCEVRTTDGQGAARLRIDAGQYVLPQTVFDEVRTKQGRGTLARYREDHDERRGISLGPLHDDASHGGDAFGLMALQHKSRLAHHSVSDPAYSSSSYKRRLIKGVRKS